jgi:hypothetical protein
VVWRGKRDEGRIQCEASKEERSRNGLNGSTLSVNVGGTAEIEGKREKYRRKDEEKDEIGDARLMMGGREGEKIRCPGQG